MDAKLLVPYFVVRIAGVFRCWAASLRNKKKTSLHVPLPRGASQRNVFRTGRPTPRGSEVLLCVRHVAVAATVTMVVLPHLGLRSRRLALLRLGLGLAPRLARDTMIILGRIDQLCSSTRFALGRLRCCSWFPYHQFTFATTACS